MTDPMTPSVPPTFNLDAEIDRMVASGSAHHVRVQGDQGAAQVEVYRDPETGQMQTSHTVLRAPTPGNAEADRMYDNGIDTRAAAEDLQRQLQASADRLTTTTGRFDSRTGQPILLLPEGSEARRIAQLQHDQLARSAVAQLHQWDALEQQRARDRAGADSRAAEERLTQAFTRGDPRRAALLREELDRAQAAEAAQTILNARRASRGVR